MKALRKNRRRGQGMTEYIIIVMAVALLSLAVVMKFGNQIRNLFIGASDELADGSGDVSKVDQAGARDDFDSIDDINETGD